MAAVPLAVLIMPAGMSAALASSAVHVASIVIIVFTVLLLT
jgi:hypothetical protein